MEIEKIVIKQIDFYFGDVNLPRDRFLLLKISENPDRYVDISLILSFRRIQRLGVDGEFVANALMKSEVCEVSPNRKQIRRRIPLPSSQISKIEPISNPKIFRRKMLYRSQNYDFSVFSFNMLKQNYTRDFAQSVKPAYLTIEHRLPLLLQEIQLNKGDIICLVESDRYVDFKNNEEVFGGYDSINSVLNQHPNEWDRHGVSIFWNKRKLRLVKYCEKQLSVVKRPVLICKFEHLPTSKKFIFCGVHLKPGQEKSSIDLRLLQIADLMNIINFLREWGRTTKTPNKIPVIISGDFNDVPQSQVYRKIVDEYGYSSSYGDFKEPYTMYCKFDYLENVSQVTLDYIFFSKGDLVVEGLLEIPEHPNIAFPEKNPGSNYPSDHLAIKTAFSFLKE